MIPSVLNPADEPMVGNDAGWLLSFCDEAGKVIREFGRDDYYAEVEATLPEGLQGGEYEFIVEGITDEHYAEIARTSANPGRAAFVDLYLFWRDTASSVTGYMKSLAGLTDLMGGLKSEQLADFLVARLAVNKVTRKKGSRRYVAEITAKERVHRLLGERLVCGKVSSDQPLELAKKLAEQAGIKVKTYPITPAAGAPARKDKTQLCAPERGRSTAATLTYLSDKIAQMSGQYGRGMLLIRDGVLHIGPRTVPLNGKPPRALHAGNGLLQIEVLKSVSTDPKFDPCDPKNRNPSNPGTPASAPTRKQFKLTLKGRGDLKPGDAVVFMPPAEDLSTAGGHWTGALGETAMAAVGGGLLPSLGLGEMGPGKVTLYVHSVNHKQGRGRGFITTLTGVEILPPSDVWDQHSRDTGEGNEEDEPDRASATAKVARAQRRLVQRALESKAFTEMAEIRAMNIKGADEPPAQTLTLWRGLAGADGGANQTRRLKIQRPSHSVAEGVPYATPFAWGKCGLVLPRYPGTRVAVTHRGADHNEPIDIGATWKSGEAPDSQPGDWWLSLPAEVPAAYKQRLSVSGEAAVAPYAGKVSQDLIDADGNRVIEVSGFTLRFGASGLKKAGKRPEAAAEVDAVSIEHASGKSKIVMKSDGSIEIKGSTITLDSGTGDIVLKGGTVKVE